MLYSGYYCDKCGTAFEYKANNNEWLPNKTYLVVRARENGWSVGKRILCPKCRYMRK